MNYCKSAALILVASCALPAGNPAIAQQPRQVEEILVISRGRAEDLQQAPASISAFTAAMIESAGIERPQDFISLTPNVSIVDTANAGDTQVTIRGQVSTRDAESNFAYVVDGVLITNPNGFNGELFDVAQIEVLKGPQGALYGRNAAAGAILVTTRPPDDGAESRVKVGAGSDGLVKAQAMFSGPLATEGLWGRLAINHKRSDGQYGNRYTGEDDTINFLEETNIRGRLLWEAGDNLRLDSQLSRREVSGGAINFNAVFALDQAAAFINVPELYADVNDHEFQYIFNVPGENEQENTFFTLKADYDLADGATLTAVFAYDDLSEYLLSDGTSAAFGGYSLGAAASQNACVQSYNSFDAGLLQAPTYAVQDGGAPGTYVAAFGGLNALLPPYSPTTCDGYQYQERNQESSSLDIRLTSSDDRSLRWLAGVYFAEIDREVVVAYGADLGRGFVRAPYVPPDGPNPTDLLFWDNFNTEVSSLYGQLQWDVADEQELSLALRYDREDRGVSNKVPNVSAAQIFGLFGPRPINPAYDGSGSDRIQDRSKDFRQLQPKLSYLTSLGESASVYATYGVGFRSGGFNSIGSEDVIRNNFGGFDTFPVAVRDEYDKEVSRSWEAGIKSTLLDARLRLNASAFVTSIDDYQFFNFFAGAFGLLRVVTNINEAEIRGFEAETAFVVNDYLSIDGGFGLIDSEIVSNRNRPYTKGNALPLAPESTANLGLEFNAPLSGNIDFAARLDWRHVGKTWFHTVQDETTTNAFTDLSALYQIPGFGFGTSTFDRTSRNAYDTLDLRASLRGENWELTAWVRNLSDEDYLEEIIPAPEFGGSFIHDSAGRIGGIDFGYRF